MTQSHNPPRPPMTLAVGITGHRPPVLTKAAAEPAAARLSLCLRSLAEAAEAVRSANKAFFADGPSVPRLVCPLADGADQIAAQAALDAHYALQVVLPLPREEYRKDFSGEALERFDLLLDRAERTLELPEQPEGRDEGYALAGRATVAHCDVLIALWDGGAARGPGGTAEVVSLALRQGLPVLHIPIEKDKEARILWAGYGDFVDPADIDSVPTRSADGAALRALLDTILGPPRAPEEIANLAQYLEEPERLLRPRVEYPLMLAALGIKRLRRSTLKGARYRDATREEWQSFHDSCAHGRHGVSAPLDGIENAFAWADRLAQHFAQSYRSGHVLNFALGAGAVVIALTGLLFPKLEFWAALCEAMAITGFVINTGVGTRRQWHRRWLEYRQLAERLRPMRSLKLLGAAAPPSREYGEGATERWVGWYAAAQWRAAGIPSGLLHDSDALTTAIIAEEIQPQLDYHWSSAHQMHMLDHRLHWMGMALLVCTIFSCSTSVSANLYSHDFAAAHAHIFISFAAGLPAIGAAIFGIRMQGDFGASAQRSLITAANLSRIVDALSRPGLGLTRQTSLAEAAAETMLAELENWHHAYAQRRLELP